MNDNYEDIIHLPHFVSKNRPHMSNADRAAQFSPFAALTGYHEAIQEASVPPMEKIILSDMALEELDEKMFILIQNLKEHPSIQLTYEKDGFYHTETVSVKRIDPDERKLISMDNKHYSFDDIIAIESPLFQKNSQM